MDKFQKEFIFLRSCVFVGILKYFKFLAGLKKPGLKNLLGELQSLGEMIDIKKGDLTVKLITGFRTFKSVFLIAYFVSFVWGV